MESSKHDWTLSVTATSLQFCSLNPFPSAKSFQFMNFSEAMFYENYLISDFHWGDKKVLALTLKIHNFLGLKKNPVKFATFPKIYLGTIGYGI